MGAEKIFENKVKRYLKSKNIWYVKYFANSFTPTGIPDLLAVVNSHFLAIEIKSEKGKTSLLQEYNIKEIRRCGGIAMVLKPSGFDDFKKLIEELLNDNIV